MQPTTPKQAELAMDHSPALELAMRTLFETRWRRWHRFKQYELAVEDPVTRQLLCLAVQHMPAQLGTGRQRGGRKP